MNISAFKRIAFLLSLLGMMYLWVSTNSAMASQETAVLARLNYSAWSDIIDLPVYAVLRDGQGKTYALVIAPLDRLEKSGLDYEILDQDASQATYIMARSRRLSATPPATGRRIYFDGRIWVIRLTTQVQNIGQEWGEAGFELITLPEEPLIMKTSQTSSLPVNGYNPDIADMISQVDADTVYTLTGQLSGEWPTVVGGAAYTMTTRNTRNTTAIQYATQFAFEYLQARGLNPSYESWSGCPTINPTSSRNVIGELPGNLLADQIVLIVGHIDDMPVSGLAPGADDNASGTVGVLMAADILRQYEFERTLRFVLFTGEEQGLCGSNAHAAAAYSRGDDIVAVLNLDMIAWDSDADPVISLHTRVEQNASYSQDLAIANAFIGAVNDYGLSTVLEPGILADGELYSDHSPFWNKGFPAILAIEDDYDFNPNWHNSHDNLAALNQTYFTNFVRAVVGTSASLGLLRMEEEIYFPLIVLTSAE